MTLDKSLASLQAKMAARGEKKAPQEPQAPARVVQLPLWPVPVRGVPNSVLRSALFGAIKRGRRAYQERVQKATVEGLKVIHTGPTLDQADLDVWEQCLQLARETGLGAQIEFNAHSFLKAIGRNTSGANHEWLKGAFARLATSLVEIEDGPRAYWGALLHHGSRDSETGRYVIEINPKILALFGYGGWTQIEWQERQALKGQPLSQWLHGFYSSHAKPHGYKVETIRKLCGSDTGELKKFRQSLRKALDALAAVTGWAWTIDGNDLVQVEKAPTRSQQRHLAKKAAKPRKPRG